jgi:large subunit ribosomal protein L24
MQKIKRDDLVVVLAGKDRGKQGHVRDVYPREGRLVVQGVNMIKRHRAQRAEGTQAGIIEREQPMPIGKVQLICKNCQKPVRATFRVRSDGVKVRVCRKCDQDID